MYKSHGAKGRRFEGLNLGSSSFFRDHHFRATMRGEVKTMTRVRGKLEQLRDVLARTKKGESGDEKRKNRQANVE